MIQKLLLEGEKALGIRGLLYKGHEIEVILVTNLRNHFLSEFSFPFCFACGLFGSSLLRIR